eukprot:TRINITY_DN7080_c0_g3_i1.p1 TRINITY_DN7080_c0_g3~~TRINITY_DN7080_c0_g3_i1.p1  ORF type:complete len:514 (-),score=97.56 TRINITY_DN7080_c0_g3_i1:48-1496(-)
MSGGLSAELKSLVHQLHDIGAIKFGKFTLKSGFVSPIYIDLRVTVSYPGVLSLVSDLMWNQLQSSKTFELICGVPYTALPIASFMSLKHNVPMVMRRKEAKGYGTKKLVEGVFKPGMNCLVIEDLVTTGGSVLETVTDLLGDGLVVTDVVVLVDRQQGGRDNLSKHNLKLHSVLTIFQVVDELFETGKLSSEVVKDVKDFIQSHQTTDLPKTEPTPKIPDVSKLSYLERASLTKNPISQKLLNIMSSKKTNLCVAVDLTSRESILKLVSEIGPHICILKTHADIVNDWEPSFAKELQRLSEEHGFLIFEDRKFADIGNSVKYQFEGGVHKIASWANLITVHGVPGPGIISALSSEKCGILLLAEMSSKGTLAKGDYTKSVLEMGWENRNSIVGFIASKKLDFDTSEATLQDTAGVLFLTPGVQFSSSGDSLDQQYNSPEQVIKNGSDVIIVGRGVYQSSEPSLEAQKYKVVAWNAYEERIKK